MTVISTVNAAPVHEFAAGVTVYLSTPPAALVNVCAIVVPHDEAQAAPPVIVLDCVALVQVKVVPLTVALSVTLLVAPLQIVCALAEPTVEGLTTTVAVIAPPTQNVGVGPVGVMVKVTVTGELVVLVKATPVMFPEPLEAIPVTSVVLFLVHANVVPATELLVPNVIVVNEAAEQIV